MHASRHFLSSQPDLEEVSLKQLMALRDEDVVHLANLSQLKTLAIVDCELVTDRGVSIACRHLERRRQSFYAFI